MQPLKRNLLSVALASATLMLFNNAYAQAAQQDTNQDAGQSDQNAEQLDAIEVVGIRRSIAASTEAKREATSIVEAVSAEDIGKLPDTSIADSIARLPGLTAQRFGGRPQEINIRGFAGDYSVTTLNGREQVSLGNNRGVEFDQYPSELVNRVLVYKTPEAGMVAQGISGTVDLQTIRPLSFGKRAVALNLRGDQNRIEGEKENGYRFSVSYIDQFADNTVGLALGYARLNNPGQSKQFGDTWGYDGSGLYGGGKLYDLENDNTRDGFMAALEYKPNANYTTVLDIFYSKFDKEEYKRGMEFGAAFSGAPLISRVNNSQGTAIEARWGVGINPVIRNDFNAAYDDLFAIGWRHELAVGDHWTFSADISGSEATREQRVLETYAGVNPALPRDTLRIRFNPAGYFETDFGYDYGDPNILRLGDPGGWGQDGYIKDFETTDSLVSLRLDAERSFDEGWLSSIEFGVNVTDREKSRSSNEAFLDLTACLNGPSPTCPGGGSIAIPTGLARDSRFGFAGVPRIYGYDALAAYNQVYTRRANVNGDISRKNWEINETVTTLYLQGNINTDIGPVSLKGNFGIQVVNADQESTGLETFPGNGAGRSTTDGANYTDYLPSLNLNFGFAWDQNVRVGLGRQLARPRLDYMIANNDISIQDNLQINPITGQQNTIDPNTGQLTRFWRREGGNPKLRPWVANALDVSYEKYFADNKGLVSLAYFYKDLRTYDRNQISIFDINDTTLRPADYPPNPPPGRLGTYRQRVNGEGGSIRGYEFAISLPFEVLWAPLEGFGFVGSYSQTYTSIPSDDPTVRRESLPGYSKYVSNMTLYYDRFGFSARVAQRSRSDFLGEVEGFGGDRTRRQFIGEKVTDVQLGYTFQDGPLKDFGILLQVNNIENEPFRSRFLDRADRPNEYFEYGRTYLLGVNYRF